MGLEASKTKQINGADFYQRFMSGSVLDIGCGPDLVVEHAQPFDQEQGDANNILEYIPAESVDCVHSSHCLEHMFDPVRCLQGWWQCVRPGGFIITVVPEENLYEQHLWPSRFNDDHKSTFRLGGGDSWSPVSFDILKLHKDLPDIEILQADIHDKNYDRDLIFPLGGRERARRGFVWRQLNSLAKSHTRGSRKKRLQHMQLRLGYPVDQTTQNGAMAQIQIVARKKKSGK